VGRPTACVLSAWILISVPAWAQQSPLTPSVDEKIGASLASVPEPPVIRRSLEGLVRDPARLSKLERRHRSWGAGLGSGGVAQHKGAAILGALVGAVVGTVVAGAIDACPPRCDDFQPIHNAFYGGGIGMVVGAVVGVEIASR